MKKQFFYMAAAAIALTSCSSEDVIEVNQGDAIEFRVSTGIGSNSRGTETTTGNLTQFFITAINSGNLYFQNALFTEVEGNKYTHSPAYYWPGNGSTVDFYGFSYYTTTNFTDGTVSDFGTVSIDGSTKQITNFTVKDEVADQVDLVTTTAQGSSQNQGSMTLTFNHVLSQIRIKAKNTNSNYKYEIMGVKIGHIKNKGTYTFPAIPATATSEGDATSAPSWSSQEGNATYEVIFSQAIALESTEKCLLGSDAVAATEPSEGDEANAVTPGTGIMAIPQEITNWNRPTTPSNGNEATATNSGSYIAVLVKITMLGTKTVIYPYSNSAATVDEGEGNTTTLPSGYAYAYVPFPNNTSWTGGNCYTYNLDFSNGAGYEDNGTPILGGAIEFSSITVTAWTNSTSEIQVPVE